jgi:hypothetical protein
MLICNWLVDRGIKPPEFDFLPPTGLILDNAACGFLIKCDNGFGILDFFITNPKVPARARVAAVDEIAACLIETAKRMGLKKLKCDTGIRSIYKMALKHGFEDMGGFSSLMRGI